MLHIDIYSFSYKKSGIPKDNTDNGGGFVFDCRGILNPGRIDEYKPQTGADLAVQEYLEEKTQMPDFLNSVKSLISISEHLQVSFGCTGGQHRSVYSAIKIGEFLQHKYADKVSVKVTHNEQPQLNA